jgi:hypothetical protein
MYHVLNFFVFGGRGVEGTYNLPNSSYWYANAPKRIVFANIIWSVLFLCELSWGIEKEWLGL